MQLDKFETKDAYIDCCKWYIEQSKRECLYDGRVNDVVDRDKTHSKVAWKVCTGTIDFDYGEGNVSLIQLIDSIQQVQLLLVRNVVVWIARGDLACSHRVFGIVNNWTARNRRHESTVRTLWVLLGSGVIGERRAN